MSWITTKDGRRVNTEWFEEDEQKKYAQIEANAKEAAAKNNEPLSYETYLKSIHKWVADMDNVTAKDREVLENFIAHSEPVEAQSLSRGITMTRKDKDNLKVGQEWGSGQLSSWSTRIGMAQAHAREKATKEKPCQVVFRFKGGTNKGAKLTGQWKTRGFSENEVIMSSTAKFTIAKIKKIDIDRTEVWLEKKNH